MTKPTRRRSMAKGGALAAALVLTTVPFAARAQAPDEPPPGDSIPEPILAPDEPQPPLDWEPTGQVPLAAVSPDFESFIEHNTTERGFKLSGRADGLSSGVALVAVRPTQDERNEQLANGPMEVLQVGAAHIAADGTYVAYIAEEYRANVAGHQLEITTLDDAGRIVGMTLTDPLEPTTTGRPALTPVGVESSNDRGDNPAGELTLDVEALTVDGVETADSPDSLDVIEDAIEQKDAREPSHSTAQWVWRPGVNSAPLFDPMRECGWGSSCCRDVEFRRLLADVNFATAGTNTRTANISATFTQGASSRLGFGLKLSGASWSIGGGTDRITNRTANYRSTPTNRYGLNAYMMEARVRDLDTFCFQWDGQNRHRPPTFPKRERHVIEYRDDATMLQWFGELQHFPGRCSRYRGTGTWTWNNHTAQTYAGGVKLGVIEATRGKRRSRSI